MAKDYQKSSYMVSVTKNQVKKHVKQMSLEEIYYLKEKIVEISNLIRKTGHSSYRMNLKNIDINLYKDLISCKGKFDIIEYNETLSNNILDHRVLVRSKTKVYRRYNIGHHRKISRVGWCNICIVFSLDSKKIITAYYNAVEDNHKTLNYDRYNKDLVIIKKEDKVCA